MTKLIAGFSRKAQTISSKNPLTDDQIRSTCPAVYAEAPHTSRSERYVYVPTSDIIKALRKEGFAPFFAVQAGTRDADRFGFTKHMLRFRHESQIALPEVNEVVLVASHGGECSTQILAGRIRSLCTNRMVSGDIVQDIRIRHSGKDVIDNVIEGVYTVLDGFESVDESREGMRAITLNRGEQLAFANSALALRYGYNEETKKIAAPITPFDVLITRRREDDGLTLASTFDVVHENLIQKGGLRGRTANGAKTMVRPVASIDANVALNRGLWVLAEEMKRLKGAH